MIDKQSTITTDTAGSESASLQFDLNQLPAEEANLAEGEDPLDVEFHLVIQRCNTEGSGRADHELMMEVQAQSEGRPTPPGDVRKAIFQASTSTNVTEVIQSRRNPRTGEPRQSGKAQPPDQGKVHRVRSSYLSNMHVVGVGSDNPTEGGGG